MSLIIGPQQQPSGWETALSSLGQGLGAGLSQLNQELQQYREQKRLSDYLGKMNKNLNPLEQLNYIAGAPVNDQLKGALMSGYVNLQKQKAVDIISPRGAQLIKKAQTGEQITPQEMQGLSDKEMRTILRAQETGGIQGAEEQKAYLSKNLERQQGLSKQASDERDVLRTLGEMENLVKTGETGDTLSNLATEYDIKFLKPMFQTPGSKAYMTGFKNLFGDFRSMFGARPAQYEAMIYEKGLPELLSPDDAKLASIYELQAIKQGKIAESEAYNHAVSELGYKASPIDIEKRATQLSEKAKDEIYDNFRMQMKDLLTKDIPLAEGEGVFYNIKENKLAKGSLSQADEAYKKGWRLMRSGQ